MADGRGVEGARRPLLMRGSGRANPRHWAIDSEREWRLSGGCGRRRAVGAAAGKQQAGQFERAFRTATLHRPRPADAFSPQQPRMEQPNMVIVFMRVYGIVKDSNGKLEFKQSVLKKM